MNDAFRVLGVLSLLTAALPGVVTLAGCENNESSGLRRDAGMGDSGAAGAAGVNADGAADQSSGGARADGAAPDLRGMDGASGGATGTGSADAAGAGDAGGRAGLDARNADMGNDADAASGGKDAAGMGGADGGGKDAAGTGGTDGGGKDTAGTGGSSGPSCPSDLPGGSAATFCVGNLLYGGISACHDGGCTCVADRYVACLNGCVKNANDSGGTCSGGFLVCPQQGSNMRRSICFLGSVYSVMSACSVTAGCNCKISQSQLCTGGCVELSDGTAECQ